MLQMFSAGQSRVSVMHAGQAYKNIGYLLLSLFLGLAYFLVLVPGILVAISTLTIWIGVPLLWGLLVLCWQCAAFERALAVRWLRVPITAPPPGPPRSRGWWPAFQERLGNRMTWKILAFLLLKFPIGLCSFTLSVTLLSLSPGLMIIGLTLGLLTAPFYALGLAALDIHNPRQRLTRYLARAAGAFGLNLVSFSLLNGLAWLQGQLARALLGMSETALRLEEARTRAEQAEQRRRELVVNVSHELRAPVASISGHLESLLLSTGQGRDLPAPPVLHAYLNVAYQEARRLGLLVDDLLSLARMEAHELNLQMQAIAAAEIVEEVYHTLLPLAQRERQVTLVRGTQPNLPPVQADRQRLIQVLTNLVRNAITSTPAGGIVSLSLERADRQHLALIVEDNGVGIPADELQRIFERFYRTDGSRTRATGGSGLGLAIVHDLVSAMGGSINVESTPGQGSRFCVRLRTQA
ncbi:MAG TPA: HAMP domain-containing sensor histidine kinase [Ktedonobacteraceae bacterium]|jgi:signal transduction histidine kinase